MPLIYSYLTFDLELMPFIRVAPLVDSPEGILTQKRVWEELSQKLESIQPGILKNI